MDAVENIKCPYCGCFEFEYYYAENYHMYIRCGKCLAYREISCKGPYWYKGMVKKSDQEREKNENKIRKN
jgi:hypothetical protein